MTTAFTPGPWIGDDGFITAAALPPCFQFIAMIGPYSGNENEEELAQLDANEALICAAPDLLAALNGMLEMWSVICDVNGWEPGHMAQQKFAVDAVAKATGELA